MSGFLIGNRKVGDGAPCLIVAEVGLAHDGSLRVAHDFIDAVASTGADAVKFQCHLAEAESTPDEPWRVEPVWPQDASRFDYWKRTAFDRDQWWSLEAHASGKGLLFLCSVFSPEAVRMLNPLVPAWKVPSGEVNNEALRDAIRVTGKPAVLSTGMSRWAEIVAGLDYAEDVAFLHCVSKYPTPAGQVGLPTLEDLQKLDWWLNPVGLSDHSGTIWPSIGAVTLGASIVEVHVKLSAHDQGFDASSSITIEQLRQLVEGVRFIEQARQPVDKDALAEELEPMRRLFMEKHRRFGLQRDMAL